MGYPCMQGRQNTLRGPEEQPNDNNNMTILVGTEWLCKHTCHLWVQLADGGRSSEGLQPKFDRYLRLGIPGSGIASTAQLCLGTCPLWPSPCPWPQDGSISFSFHPRIVNPGLWPPASLPQTNTHQQPQQEC